jgi:aldehyde dehydrogenase (NAD+)
MAINREELFAPIACVIRARDYEHALEILNDTDFGLTAGIITQSLATASDFKKRAVSGCVMVNLPTAGTDYHVPVVRHQVSVRVSKVNMLASSIPP